MTHAETKLTLEAILTYSGQEVAQKSYVVRINLPQLKTDLASFKAGHRFRAALLDLVDQELAFFDLHGSTPVLIVSIPSNFYA